MRANSVTLSWYWKYSRKASVSVKRVLSGIGLLIVGWLRIWLTTLARQSRRPCRRRSSGWCVSEGVRCGGGLSGRKYVSVAEDCSVEGDHKAEGGRRSAEAIVNKGRGCTSSSRKVKNGCGGMKQVDDQSSENTKQLEETVKSCTR